MGNLEEHTDFLEWQMSNVAQAHNSVVDTQDKHAHLLHQIRLKIADMEDRLWRNNKVQGHSNYCMQMIKPGELTSCLQRLFHTIPNLSPLSVRIDRAHRIQKPDYLPATVPRDTLTCLHFFHVKDQLMWATRTMRKLPEPYQNISLYSDISAATAQAHKSSDPVTAILRERNIIYRQGIPMKLLVSCQNQLIPFLTPKDDPKQLHNWCLVSIVPPSTPRSKPSPRISDPWIPANNTFFLRTQFFHWFNMSQTILSFSSSAIGKSLSLSIFPPPSLLQCAKHIFAYYSLQFIQVIVLPTVYALICSVLICYTASNTYFSASFIAPSGSQKIYTCF